MSTELKPCPFCGGTNLGFSSKTVARKYGIRCLEDGKIYATAGEAARTYGIVSHTVTSSCNRLSTKGRYNFRYVEEIQ